MSEHPAIGDRDALLAALSAPSTHAVTLTLSEKGYCLAGDGSLIMTVQELATCVTEQIPVKVFLMNNGYYGMVRQWQELFWDNRY